MHPSFESVVLPPTKWMTAWVVRPATVVLVGTERPKNGSQRPSGPGGLEEVDCASGRHWGKKKQSRGNAYTCIRVKKSEM